MALHGMAEIPSRLLANKKAFALCARLSAFAQNGTRGDDCTIAC